MAVPVGRPRRRAVLLQFRLDDGPRRQERHCFRVAGLLEPEELVAHNMAESPHLAWRDVADADVVLFGGAGDFSATEEHPFTAAAREILARCIEEGRPVLGSCFGHHLLAQVTGGSVATVKASEEIGTFPITLTEAGRRDPLLRDLPGSFSVQLGHHDAVTAVGRGLVELAASARCRFQILRMADRPVYSTQFHAELDEESIRRRLLMYRAAYLEDAGPLDSVWRRIHPSPFAPLLLQRFLEAYC